MTAAFAAVMALLLLGISLSVFWSMRQALLDELDSGLRFRAAATASSSPGATVETPNPSLEERAEAFDQLLTRDGRVLRSSVGIPRGPLLSPRQLRGLDRPTFFERRVPGVQDRARLLAVPVGGASSHEVLLVGTTMADLTDALQHLVVVFLIAAPAGLVLASAAGWFVAGLGLRPVEKMRRQASAITASGLDHRLDMPHAKDEVHRLGATLNQMLDRLETAARHDQRFLERVSHELRTPLTALKAELEVATAGPGDSATLTAAIASATDETNHLTRLAIDLLALARSHDGRMPIKRDISHLRTLLDSATAAHHARALRQHVTVTANAPDLDVCVDAMRVRQALDNLLDNALRHARRATTIQITASQRGESLHIVVEDDGPGFASLQEVRSLLTSDVRSPPPNSGLGLRIAQAVATSHGGHLLIDNRDPHGAVATLVLPAAGVQRAMVQPQ